MQHIMLHRHQANALLDVAVADLSATTMKLCHHSFCLQSSSKKRSNTSVDSAAMTYLDKIKPCKNMRKDPVLLAVSLTEMSDVH